jgi:hypothetical protein
MAMTMMNPKPMIQYFSSSSSSDSTSTKVKGGDSSNEDDEARRRKGRASGNWLLGLGWTLLAVVVVDQLLQYKQEEEAKERRILLAKMQYEADCDNVATFDVNLPTLFECTVRHVEHSLDGTMMLMSRSGGPGLPLRVGEIVEIVEANIGPNGAYHLCRLRRSGTNKNGLSPSTVVPVIGWYPVEFLERI